mgnify:CR=1 FL=1
MFLLGGTWAILSSQKAQSCLSCLYQSFLLPIHKLNKFKKGFFLILCLIFISDWELARVSPAPEGLSGRPPGGVEKP